jgi:autoinducer 2-degrading protein
MFMVFVTLDVREDRRDDFVAGVRVNAQASLRDEPGCLRFDVQHSTDRPERYYLYELYRDRQAFEVEHRNAPHYSEWLQVAERCVIPGTHVNRYAEPVFPDDIPEQAAVP